MTVLDRLDPIQYDRETLSTLRCASALALDCLNDTTLRTLAQLERPKYDKHCPSDRRSFPHLWLAGGIDESMIGTVKSLIDAQSIAREGPMTKHMINNSRMTTNQTTFPDGIGQLELRRPYPFAS